jgi:hypothetical protein
LHAGGSKVIDIERMLSEVEIHAPNGERVEFEAIAFIDQPEFKRMGRLQATQPPSSRN